MDYPARATTSPFVSAALKLLMKSLELELLEDSNNWLPLSSVLMLESLQDSPVSIILASGTT